MPIKQEPLGTGKIIWLGINGERGTFSQGKQDVVIGSYGIEGDHYRSLERRINGHDVDYIETDGVSRGDPVINLRQITIVEESEVADASQEFGSCIEPGMLRENMLVRYHPHSTHSFSKLPPLSRMVIGGEEPKVLLLTEENGPCTTISGMIAKHYKQGKKLRELRDILVGRRGQMAMVKSLRHKLVAVGDEFIIYPPFT